MSATKAIATPEQRHAARRGAARRVALRHARRRHDDNGQSLVELGILIPLLLVIVLGAIDFGRAYYAYVTVTNAARAGAQYASVSNANAADTEGITAAVDQEAGSLSGSPTVTASSSTDSRGKSVAMVTVAYRFNTLFAWPGLPHNVPMTQTVQMRVAP